MDRHRGLRRGELHPDALEAEGLWEAADARATEATAIGDGQLPLLLAISDNGPQMRSHSTREFLAGIAIAQQFGRPGVSQDQGWIETLFGHVKGEWPQAAATSSA